jgi:hypothetical protein
LNSFGEAQLKSSAQVTDSLAFGERDVCPGN